MSIRRSRPTPVERVTSDRVADALRSVVEAQGGVLERSRRRGLHRHGGRAASAIHLCAVRSADRVRDIQYVVHASDRDVPDGAFEIAVDGASLWVWPYPRDPYLPGLERVARRDHAGAVLRAQGHRGEVVRIVSLRYRPTRRAVVTWAFDDDGPAMYVKVAGGRTPRRVREHAEEIAATHDQLIDHLPVPRVLHRDVAAGIVGLAPLAGDTLRDRLRTNGQLPDADDVLDITRRMAAVEDFRGDGDPTGYADVSRHVTTLISLVGDLRADIERAAAAAAATGGPSGLVHGDLHDGQLLVTGTSVTGVLDIDGVGRGLLAQDLGRLVANVQAAAGRSGVDADRVETFVEELFEGAQSLAPAVDIARAAAGAWLALATGPHRVQSSTWEPDTRTRIARAVMWADRAARP